MPQVTIRARGRAVDGEGYLGPAHTPAFNPSVQPSIISGEALITPSVDRFSDLADVAVLKVDLPAEPPPQPRTRTVDGEPPADLVAHAKPSSALEVAILANATLAWDCGAVVHADGRIVRQSIWDDEQWRRDFSPPPELPPAVRVPGRHASLMTLYSNNYYHWVLEALPRLAVLAASGVQYDGLIVPAELLAFQRRSLELAGVEPEQLIPFAGSHLAPDELVWPAPLAPIGHPTAYSVKWLRETFAAPSGPPTRRLYLTRKVRRVANEKQVMRVLASAGFESVDVGGLDFGEQVTTWADTSVAIGPHGAAFTGSAFSAELAALEIYAPWKLNSTMTALLTACGHPHWSLVGRRAPLLSRMEHHATWVPIDRLRRALRQMSIL